MDDLAITKPERRLDLEFQRGDEIGRYIIVERLGAGAMGVVYGAYDPELDRKVALKVLRPRPGTDPTFAHHRLLREAQALARVNHPNVVAIHDFGEHEGRIFIAMEVVDGVTLTQWLDHERRPWRQVVRTFLQAGHGLSAAHAKGLVHRDFKPDNVMIDTDGRVRVLDFGLVRGDSSHHDTDSNPRRRALALHLTCDGAAVGTPAYMAPEQIVGTELGPETDQFAFCVSLWEALYDVPPFLGETTTSRTSSVVRGEIAAPPKTTKVPRRLARILRRGLEQRPWDRWPSMEALLAELERAAQYRSRWGTFALVTVGTTIAGMATLYEYDVERRKRACQREGAAIADVWDDSRHSRLRASLARSGSAHAMATADRVLPLLDGYASEWSRARAQACEATSIQRTWSTDLHARAAWCLEDRTMELESFVAELLQADQQTVDSAVLGATSLPPIASCVDLDVIGRMSNPPTDRVDDVRAVRANLARANVQQQLGAYQRGLSVARGAHMRAESVGHAGLRVRARHRIGALLAHAGQYEEAKLELEQAFFDAARLGVWEIAHQAALDLVFVVGHQLSRPDEGLRWSQHAEVMLARLADPGELQAAHQMGIIAAVQSAVGQHEVAAALFEQALRIQEAALGEDHPTVAASLNNAAVAASAAGRHDDARALQERALEIQRHALGRGHPYVATSMANLGLLHRHAGDWDSALAITEGALEIRRELFGDDHPDVAQTLNNLAAIHVDREEYRSAETLLLRALEIRTRLLGEDHPLVANTITNLAAVYQRLAQLDEARVMYERALPLLAESPQMTTVSLQLASVCEQLGDLPCATKIYQDVLRRQEALDPDGPLVAKTLLLLAQSRTSATAGLEEATRALHLRERAGASASDMAEAQFVVAQIAWRAGERRRSLDLADRAAQNWRDVDPAAAQRVENWIASRRANR